MDLGQAGRRAVVTGGGRGIARAAVPALREAPPGTAAIVNVAPASGRYPEPTLVDYAASKAAVRSPTGALATELGADRIRVSAVSPGPTGTPLRERPGGFTDGLAARYGLPARRRSTTTSPRCGRSRLARRAPPKRSPTPSCSCCQARARHVSDAVLDVHGGMTTHLM